MKQKIALALVLVAAAAGCNRDKSGGAGQTTKVAARDSVPLAAPQQSGGAAAVKGALNNPATKAPAPPPPAPTAVATELQSAPQVFTVQVASFVNASTAQALRTRLQRAGVPAWTTTATVGGQEFTRVRVGGSTTDAGARAVAAKIRATYQWPVWVTRVENRSALPADVLTTTRTFAGGT